MDYFACDLYDTMYQVEANVIASGWSGMSQVSTDMHRYAAVARARRARRASRSLPRVLVRGSQDTVLRISSPSGSIIGAKTSLVLEAPSDPLYGYW